MIPNVTQDMIQMNAPLVAALPFRFVRDSGIAVLLIMPADESGWTLPTGDVGRRARPHESAAHHAFEQAGIAGWMCETSIGSCMHCVRRATHFERNRARVYVLEADGQARTWPKKKDHQIGWFAASQAATFVADPGLRAILRSLSAEGLHTLINEARLRAAIGRELRSRHRLEVIVPTAMLSLLDDLDSRQR